MWPRPFAEYGGHTTPVTSVLCWPDVHLAFAGQLALAPPGAPSAESTYQGPVPGTAAAPARCGVAPPRGNGPLGKQEGTTGKRILAPGQHQGSTSALRTARIALATN